MSSLSALLRLFRPLGFITALLLRLSQKWWWNLLFPSLALLLAYGLILWSHARIAPTVFYLLALGSGLLIALLITQQWIVWRSNARLLRSEQRRVNTDEVLLEFSRQLLATTAEDMVFEAVVEVVCQALHTEFSALTILDERQYLTIKAIRGWEEAWQHASFKVDLSSQAGYTVLHGQPVIVEDFVHETRFIVPEVLQAGIVSGVSVPLFLEGKILGALTAQSRKFRHFDAEDIRLLTLLTNQATLALRNVRLFDAARRRAQELEVVRQVSLQLNTTLELPAVFEVILRSVLNLVADVRDVHLFLYTAGRLTFGAARWADGRSGQRYPPPRPEGLTYTVARTGEMLALPDLSAAALYAGTPRAKHGALVGLPLKMGMRVVGVLNVAYHQPRVFDDSELSLLTLLSDQAAGAIEGARLFDVTQRRVQELTALHVMAVAGAEATTEDELIERVTNALSLTLYPSNCGVLLIERATRRLWVHPSYRDLTGPRLLDYLPAGQGICGQVAASGQPCRVGDVTLEPAYLAGSPNTRSELCVPLKIGERVLGVINLESEAADAFSEADELLLLTMAGQLATALERGRLFAAEERRVAALTALHEVGLDLSAQLELATLLRALVERARRFLQAPIGALYLMRPATNDLELVAHLAPSVDLTGARQKMGEGVAGQVAQTRQALLVDDYLQWEQRLNTDNGVPLGSVIGVPIQWREVVSGVLVVADSQTYRFDQTDLELVGLFANQAAVAIENARLFEAQEQRAAELEALRQANLSVTAHLELGPVLETILSTALKFTVGAHDAHIFLYEAEHDRLTFGSSLWSSGEKNRMWSEPRQNGLTYAAARRGEMIVVSDIAHHPLFTNRPNWVGSIIALPLKIGDRTLGVMNVAYELHVHDFSESEIRMLSLLGDQAAIAIENARLFTMQEHRTAELEAVRQASLSLITSLELQPVLEAILREALQLVTEAHEAYVFTYHPEAEVQAMRFGAFLAQSGSREHENFEPRPEGLTYTVARRGEMIVVPDMRTHPLFAGSPHHWGGAILGLPLKISQRVVGVMNVVYPAARAFPEAELRVLRLLGDQAAIAIENARLFEEARLRTQEMVSLYKAAQDMGASLDAETVLFRLARNLTDALEATSGYVMEINLEQMSFTILAEYWSPVATSVERTSDVGRAYLFADYPATWRAVADQQTLTMHPTDVDLSGVELQQLRDFGVKAALLVPIVLRGKVLGSAEIWETRRARHFSSAEKRLAQTLAQHAAGVLENVRLYEALANEKSRLELLYDLSQHLTTSLNPREVASRALEKICDAFGVFEGSIYVAQSGADRLTLIAASRLDAAQVTEMDRRVNLHVGEGVGGWVALKRTAVVVDDASLDSRWQLTPGMDDTARSIVSVPLIAGDKLVGVLNLHSAEPGAFHPEQLPFLTAAAAPVAVALQNARLYAAEALRVRDITLLNDITRVAIVASDPRQMVQIFADRLAELTGADAAHILLWDETRQRIEPAVVAGPLSQAETEPTELTLAESVLSAGFPLAMENVAGSEVAFGLNRREKLYLPMRSLLGLPLMAGEQRIGAVVVTFHQTHHFSQDEIARGSQASAQVALALAKARLFEDLHRRAAELETLTKVSAALRAAQDVEEMLPIFLEKAAEIINATRCAIYLQDPDTGYLVIRGTRPLNADTHGVHLPAGEGVSGYVLSTGEVYVTSDFARDSLTQILADEQELVRGIQSGISLPLRTHEKVVGVMHLGIAHQHRFTANEVRLLVAVADIAGNALHRASVMSTLEERVAHRTSELARANERLTELDRLKDQFVSNVSHELRTPLTNISLYLNLLERRGAEALPRYLPTLQRETSRLKDIIEDLLDLSRMRTQTVNVRREAHLLDEVLTEVLTIHASRIELKNLDLRHHPAPVGLQVWIDRGQIAQVFNNLVGNAVAYTPTGGGIQVETEVVEWRGVSGAAVRFQNDGPAIPADDQAHLFERFYRGQTGRDSGEPGTGLGLAICKEIVEHHGGHIEVASTDEIGTQFTVWLPLEEGHLEDPL